ncbi:terpene synthase family protein [Actinomadura macrotermitis]|uniref:terpene synthase family protein n=1 Tax=Actinomadura macrotermitis TaxID=2585200 RepID=UPI00129701D4|nr:terpene synthase family protein [Actinomadura macrotermitis]
MNVTLLLSLAGRVPPPPDLPPGPPPPRPDAGPLGERLDTWARSRGLVLGDPTASALGRARCDRLAARLFPVAPLGRVELAARWLVWAFALDDALDTAPLGDSATAVHDLYENLLTALRRDRPRPGAQPLETALVELWQQTAPGFSRVWRHRFVQHMQEHQVGCAEEAVNRRVGKTPSPAGYPGLRRRASAPFLYDLVEPTLGIELPPRLPLTPGWKALVEGTADLVAWSNDVVSHREEAARGDTHNHVAVLGAAHGLTAGPSLDAVAGRIAARAEEVTAAVKAVHGSLDRLGFSAAEQADIARIMKVVRDAPRAHLEWLWESGRYRTAQRTVAQHVPEPHVPEPHVPEQHVPERHEPGQYEPEQYEPEQYDGLLSVSLSRVD